MGIPPAAPPQGTNFPVESVHAGLTPVPASDDDRIWSLSTTRAGAPDVTVVVAPTRSVPENHALPNIERAFAIVVLWTSRVPSGPAAPNPEDPIPSHPCLDWLVDDVLRKADGSGLPDDTGTKGEVAYAEYAPARSRMAMATILIEVDSFIDSIVSFLLAEFRSESGSGCRILRCCLPEALLLWYLILRAQFHRLRMSFY